MRLRKVWMSALALTFAAKVAACGGGKQETANAIPEPAAGATKIDPATAGDVKGTVALDGAAPMNDGIKMNAGPVCVQANKTPQFQETYEVSDGKLANVFVYVKD